jgi:hypothetical protein
MSNISFGAVGDRAPSLYGSGSVADLGDFGPDPTFENVRIRILN